MGVDARGRGNTCLGIKIIMWVGGSCLLLALFCSYLTLTEEVLALALLGFAKDLNAALFNLFTTLGFIATRCNRDGSRYSIAAL